MAINELVAMITAEALSGWLLAIGAGMLWLGLQILWVGGLPRLFRRRVSVPSAEPGSPQAFMIFWLDQYSWIGAVLTGAGLLLILLVLLPLGLR